MGRIFTLKTENTDKLEHLNGKMFKIKVDDHSKRMAIIDANTGKLLRLSTAMVDKVETEYGCKITTKSGQVYDLVDIASLIPTRAEETDAVHVEATPVDVAHKINDILAPILDENEEPDLTDIVDPISEEDIFRHIEYGDGYHGTVYRFPENIKYETFIKFLKYVKNKDLSKMEHYAWYEDHPKIFKYPLSSGTRHENLSSAKEGDESDVWTYIVVRPYTD